MYYAILLYSVFVIFEATREVILKRIGLYGYENLNLNVERFYFPEGFSLLTIYKKRKRM